MFAYNKQQGRIKKTRTKVRPRPKLESLKEDMQQKWTLNKYLGVYHDQYDFEIRYPPQFADGNKYSLYWHGQHIVTVHSLVAAKEISKILINDQIEK